MKLMDDFKVDILNCNDYHTGMIPALIKAKYYFEQFQMPVVCDDTGLFIDALNGEPGINAARFSGLGEARNRAKVLKLLDGSKNRHAAKSGSCLFIRER